MKFLDRPIWPLGDLIGSTTPGESGPGSNDSERVLHNLQSWSLIIGCHTQKSLFLAEIYSSAGDSVNSKLYKEGSI